MNFFVILFPLVSSFFNLCVTERSFVVDYANKQFLKDGEPFRYISGSFHFSRTLPDQWEDRLLKMKAGGLNAVQTYVMWNFHSTEEGIHDFSGSRDVERFMQLANDTGLLVILRPGPYVCAEWEFGGFPWYLMKNGTTSLRSSDAKYLSYVDEWYDILLPKFKRFTYANGGPIISAQIENEYGSYFRCDKPYLNHLVSKFQQHLGDDLVLFTVDSDSSVLINCGALKSQLATVDFGVTDDPQAKFKVQRRYMSDAPLVNSEFYTGWLNHWGQDFHNVDASSVAESLDKILALNASVNVYMYVGGTNFGYYSGANNGVEHDAFDITSYDYGAPISESGDTTWKFFEMKQVIEKYFPTPNMEIPANSTKTSLSNVKMQCKGFMMNYFNLLTNSSGYVISEYPRTMENMGFNYGFVLYRTKLTQNIHNSVLEFERNGLGDRATVFVASEDYSNSVYLGTLDNELRWKPKLKLEADIPAGGYLVLLIENRGRVNFGRSMEYQTMKGIRGNVTLDSHVLKNWEAAHLHLERLGKSELESKPDGECDSFQGLPQVYQTSVSLQQDDTFLNLTSFDRGVALVDEFSLGRYWSSAGPQQTLYVPAASRSSNSFLLTLVEFNSVSSNQTVDFLDYPILDVPTK